MPNLTLNVGFRGKADILPWLGRDPLRNSTPNPAAMLRAADPNPLKVRAAERFFVDSWILPRLEIAGGAEG